LCLAFERQEVIISAAAFTWKRTADGWSRQVDCASPRLGIEEATDAPEVRIRLPPHDVFAAMVGAREGFSSLVKRETVKSA